MSLESHEDGSLHKYTLKVTSELLLQASLAGIDLDEFVGFFATQVQNMFCHPPNFRMFKTTARVWIMRGFYPESSLFFKIVLIGESNPAYAKVTALRMNNYRKRAQSESAVIFNSEELNENATEKMENILLDTKYQIRPLLPNGVKMPKCMSPRGMPLFKYKKPKKSKKKPT
jgi:hypothetical protein